MSERPVVFFDISIGGSPKVSVESRKRQIVASEESPTFMSDDYDEDERGKVPLRDLEREKVHQQIYNMTY
jgi:hypothetical protein